MLNLNNPGQKLNVNKIQSVNNFFLHPANPPPKKKNPNKKTNQQSVTWR